VGAEVPSKINQTERFNPNLSSAPAGFYGVCQQTLFSCKKTVVYGNSRRRHRTLSPSTRAISTYAYKCAGSSLSPARIQDLSRFPPLATSKDHRPHPLSTPTLINKRTQTSDFSRFAGLFPFLANCWLLSWSDGWIVLRVLASRFVPTNLFRLQPRSLRKISSLAHTPALTANFDCMYRG
jgi:hypothetical protein